MIFLIIYCVEAVLTKRDSTSESLLQEKLSPQSLVDLAYHAVIEAIVDRRLEPGSRINIDFLARQLEMSNTPIREALSRAVFTGLVEQSSNRGFIVAQLLAPEQYHDLFEARHLLEVESLRHAVVSLETAERLCEIALEISRISYGTTYRTFQQLLGADEVFHHLLIQESGNNFLVEAWNNLHFYLHVSHLHTNQDAFSGENFHNSLKDHLSIAECLRDRNQAEAMKLLSKHIRSSEKRLMPFLEASP